ncbi:MAG: SRPBCC domain-containing protein [Xanthobacteraceae bacterium]|jgi:uncharacterized protein YndB with AHSA1/START domain
MPYTYTLTSIIPASAQEIYDAWLDSLVHSEMTGGEATTSDEIGAEVSAWDGYIRGRNLELVPGERIVQSWRTTEFTDEHEDSIVTLTLEEADDGTLLTLVHSNVPDDQRSYEEGGWESKYLEPMKVYFANLERGAAGSPSKRAAPKVAAGKKAKRAAPKVAAGKKAKTVKRAAPRGKAASGKKKTKRVVAAKAKGKSAKPSARKAAGRMATKSRPGRRKRTRR